MAPTFTEIKKDAIDPLQANKITQTVAMKRAEAPMREFMFDQTRSKDIAPLRPARPPQAAEDPRRHPDLRPDPRLHDLRAQDGLPDRAS
jgi:flagellar biosynthetic protein FliP